MLFIFAITGYEPISLHFFRAKQIRAYTSCSIVRAKSPWTQRKLFWSDSSSCALRCPFMILQVLVWFQGLSTSPLLVRGSVCLCFAQSLPYTMNYKEGTCFEGLHICTFGSWPCAAYELNCVSSILALSDSIHIGFLMFHMYYSACVECSAWVHLHVLELCMYMHVFKACMWMHVCQALHFLHVPACIKTLSWAGICM